VSENNLLKKGWISNNNTWHLIEPKVKEAITEFLSPIMDVAILGNNKNNTPIKIRPWLKQRLTQFFDKRFNELVPRFGRVGSNNFLFWNNIQSFELLTNRLIQNDYCNNQAGINLVQEIQNLVYLANQTILLDRV
jgi:hypothetical protein